MAKNKVILTAGEAIKREARLVSGTTAPGRFVMPAANADKDEANAYTDKSTGAVAPTTADYIGQIAVVDLSSVNGMAWLNEAGTAFTYPTGSQVPILYPTNGCIINVVCASDAAIAMGADVGLDATGSIVAATSADTRIGVANENWDPDDYENDVIKKIKVEVLK